MATCTEKSDAYKLPTEFFVGHVVHTTNSLDGNTTIQTKWRREREIGSGGFGTVWLEKENSGELRAVKRLPRSCVKKNLKFMREIETLIELRQYPDLFVQFHGWFENEEYTFLVMEYIEDGDLSQYLQDFREKAKKEAHEIMQQLLQGLVVLHEKKICHRDLKPQNVLVSSRSPIRVKIADFGVSKLQDGTQLRTRIGTTGYCAPELLGIIQVVRSVYSNAVDLWALGCILHEILTSEVPFLGGPWHADGGGTGSNEFSGVQEEWAAPDIDMIKLFSYCSGKIEFPTEALRNSGASEEAVTFLKNLLIAEPSSRISARECLKSQWLEGLITSVVQVIPEDPSSRIRTNIHEECLEHFRRFIRRDKPGLSLFYDEESLAASATRGADMITQLLQEGCGKEVAKDLALLTLYNIVLLIDDSSSMEVEERGERIEITKTMLKEIAGVYDLANPQGILSVRFLNTDKGRKNVTKTKAETLLDTHIYKGITRIGTELEKKVLNRFVWDPNHPMAKPLIVIIITDGAVEGEKNGLLQGVIAHCVSELGKGSTPGEHAVAFQFAQVGDDKGATELLRTLSSQRRFEGYVDCLPGAYRLEKILDVRYKWTVLTKLLLGAILSDWDTQDDVLDYETRDLDPELEDESDSDWE